MDSTPQMYFLQNDTDVTDTRIESEAIPFNMIVNNQTNEISIPVPKDSNFIDSTTTDQNPINDINIPKLYNYSLNIQSNIDVELLSNPYEISSQLVTRTAGTAVSQCNTKLQDNVENSKLTITNKENLNKNKRKKSNGIVHLQDRIVPPRAVAVLPAALYLRRGFVVPRRALPARVKFGPVQGVHHRISQETACKIIMNAAASKIAIFLIKVDNYITHIDVFDHDKSNWFCLLPLGDQSTANVWLYQEDNALYGITVHSISSRTPLVLGYSKQYADDIGIPLGQPVLNISKELSEDYNRWWCNECEKAFSTASLLQRHMDIYHRDTKKRRTRRGRYRCRNCDLTYSRFFTLKRHMTLYCSKNLENMSEAMTLNIDDTRLPSDESLQNFTNGLDFSTSLFDTDRISNLDISGSSKSESEFNPYGLVFNKHESILSANLDFSTNEVDKPKKTEEEENLNMKNDSLLVSCPHCKQIIAKDKEKHHLRECPERNLKCECGRIFSTKEKLSQHIIVHHHSSNPDKNSKTNSKEFKCDKCPLTYMRRGMFVNHMWRVHKTSRVSVPLERRILHYPCVACPKLYRTASKRDRHVRAHHPGVELVKGSSIESGTRSCEPAACPVCPRQYVTRAKLLQHLRAAHPDVAPPIQKSVKSKASTQNQPNTTTPTSSNPPSTFNYFG